MKKLLTILLMLSLLLPAMGEVVGTAGEGEYIHAYTADNGQVIYFAAQEETPFVMQEDVNFDGALDLVVRVAAGAGNGYFEFFVFDGEKYVMATHPGSDQGICNYRLYPEKGLVFSHANNGFAGALHEYRLFCWDGTEMKTIRRACAEQESEYVWYDDGYALRVYDDRLRVTVTIYDEALERWNTVLEETVSLQDGSWMQREESAFRQGL